MNSELKEALKASAHRRVDAAANAGDWDTLWPLAKIYLQKSAIQSRYHTTTAPTVTQPCPNT
jgi:hypothetical protein